MGKSVTRNRKEMSEMTEFAENDIEALLQIGYKCSNV